jgi:hypothetical protein
LECGAFPPHWFFTVLQRGCSQFAKWDQTEKTKNQSGGITPQSKDLAARPPHRKTPFDTVAAETMNRLVTAAARHSCRNDSPRTRPEQLFTPKKAV